MATQRYISTSFWDDKWIMELDPSEKLLYLYLLTNPLTNIAGIYKITVKRISFDTGFTPDTIGHIFQKFQKANKAHLVGEFIILPSWPKHQHWQDRSKIKTGILIQLSKLPQEIINKAIEFQYAFEIPSDIPHTYPSNYSDSDSDSDSDIDTDTDTPKREAFETVYSQEFEEWWKVYLRKDGKIAAFRLYKTTKKKGATKEMLLMAALCYSNRCKKDDTSPKYIFLPRTFLGRDMHWLEWYRNAEQIRQADEMRKIKNPSVQREQIELTPEQQKKNQDAVSEMMEKLNLKFASRRV